jgi:3-deoxy-D-manno-octulosonate 8-phosphate phosphatase (KDO 8-P phosphatase)
MKTVLKNVEWLVLDVDGVLTDGRLFFTSSGEELKVFDVKDGLGMKNLRAAGVRVGIISGRENFALKMRLNEIGVDFIKLGRPDKGAAYFEAFREFGASLSNFVVIGDDLPDVELFSLSKYSFAVSDAVEEVKLFASHVLEQRGGRGAVRAVCDMILESKRCETSQNKR